MQEVNYKAEGEYVTLYQQDADMMLKGAIANGERNRALREYTAQQVPNARPGDILLAGGRSKKSRRR